MKNKTLIIIGLTVFFVLIGASRLTQAETVTFNLSVTIPEIPGVNVPPYADDLAKFTQQQKTDEVFQVIEEEVFRGNQLVLLKTITVR